MAQARSVVQVGCADPGILHELVESSALRLHAAPARPPVTSVDGYDPLSERELEVLRLLGGTLSLPEVASELYVAHNTVKTHTRTIYRKLGAASRGRRSHGRALRLL